MKRRGGPVWKSCRPHNASRFAAIAWTWEPRSTKPVPSCCRRPRAWWIASTLPSCSTRRLTPSEKKITRAYKANLSVAERKEFYALMWEFRRDPEKLNDEERQKLETLFKR